MREKKNYSAPFQTKLMPARLSFTRRTREVALRGRVTHKRMQDAFGIWSSPREEDTRGLLVATADAQRVRRAFRAWSTPHDDDDWCIPESTKTEHAPWYARVYARLRRFLWG